MINMWPDSDHASDLEPVLETCILVYFNTVNKFLIHKLNTPIWAVSTEYCVKRKRNKQIYYKKKKKKKNRNTTVVASTNTLHLNLIFWGDYQGL